MFHGESILGIFVWTKLCLEENGACISKVKFFNLKCLSFILLFKPTFFDVFLTVVYITLRAYSHCTVHGCKNDNGCGLSIKLQKHWTQLHYKIVYCLISVITHYSTYKIPSQRELIIITVWNCSFKLWLWYCTDGKQGDSCDPF